VSTWSLLRRSIDLELDAVPEGIDMGVVRGYLAALPLVHEVHDLHIWAMSTTDTALTAHLVMPGNACEPRFLGPVTAKLSLRPFWPSDHEGMRLTFAHKTAIYVRVSSDEQT
jgi:cobalt-zinc-cadmium efflux system protein